MDTIVEELGLLLFDKRVTSSHLCMNLSSVAELAAQSMDNQETLGRQLTGKLVQVLDHPVALENISVARACVEAVTKLCRREGGKDTACVANCALLAEQEGCFAKLLALSATHADDAVVAGKVMWCVAVLCSDSEERQVKFSGAGASDEIVRVLKIFTSDAAVCENACKAVRNLSIQEETSAKLMEASISEALFDIMAAHEDNASVIECVAWALVNLSCDSSMATILGANRCCSSTAHALVKWVAGANAGVDDTAQSAFAASQAEAPTLPHALCWAIRNMSCSSTYNLPILHNTQVCDAVISALKLFARPAQSELGNNVIGMHCMANLACHGDMSKTLVDKGGCKLALDCLVEQGAALAAKVAAPGFDMYDDEDVDLVGAALSAVRNLASGEPTGGQAVLLAAGGMAAVMEVLEVLYVEQSHAEAALGAMVNLMSNDADARRTAGVLGLGELAVKTLAHHPGSEMLGEMGAKVIAHLCMGREEQKENRRRVRDAGFLKVVSEMMQNIRYSEPAVRAGCDALLHGHFLGCDDGDGGAGGDAVLAAEVALLKEKKAIDDDERAVIDDWTFDEVKEAWLARGSVVALIGAPRETTAADRKAAADAAAAAGIEGGVVGDAEDEGNGSGDAGDPVEQAALMAALKSLNLPGSMLTPNGADGDGADADANTEPSSSSEEVS